MGIQYRRLLCLVYCIAEAVEVLAAQAQAPKSMRINHFSRQNGEIIEREVLATTALGALPRYWYLPAWSHVREDVRSVSIDAIPRLEIHASAVKEVSDNTIEDTVGAGYGIFNGLPKAWAALKFTPERSRRVYKETWHQQQVAHTETDGSLVLTFPYSDDRELMGDHLRFGADVEVVGPSGLRSKAQKQFLGGSGEVCLNCGFTLHGYYLSPK